MSDQPHGLLRDARVYLSGPMDFVASRAVEKASGWRTRVGQFLRELGVTVFDPWDKPEVRGMYEYGREGETIANARADWTFEPGEQGAKARGKIADSFWPALHIDLRMVDTSDFVVCYCPTNIYSVGTPHEIILARQQQKPVLFVSPYVSYPTLHELRAHLKDDAKAMGLLDKLAAQVPIKENLNASPSLWFMPLVGGEHFFDGFGFEMYREKFKWGENHLDESEKKHKPKKSLLSFIEQLNHELPKRWDSRSQKFVENDDWILWDLQKGKHGGSVGGEKQGPG